jgi:hypothetical protein
MSGISTATEALLQRSTGIDFTARSTLMGTFFSPGSTNLHLLVIMTDEIEPGRPVFPLESRLFQLSRCILERGLSRHSKAAAPVGAPPPPPVMAGGAES